MRFPRHYSIIKGELNIAPLIDVVFLQLIYFLLTSSFIMQPGIKIQLPQATTSETIEEKQIVVSISREGVIFYKERAVDIEELETIFTEQRQSGKILIIRGDKKAEHGIVVSVMDKARKSGINRIVIGTMPEIK